MKKQSFLYQKESVFKACMKALGKQGYHVKEVSDENGTVRAIFGSGIWDAKVQIDIKLNELDSSSTDVTISVTIAKQGMLHKCSPDRIENQFIDMLYRCVNARSSFYSAVNEEHTRLRSHTVQSRHSACTSTSIIKGYAYELV